MHLCKSFLEEGSGSLSQENLNGRDSDGTTIPKLTLKLGDEKREGYGDEEKDVPTEKYPDVDEGKEDGKDDDDETSGNEEGSPTAGLNPKESEEEEKSDETTALIYNEEQDLSSIKPDPGYSEIGVWDNKVGEVGSETARQNELENIMEKLKEVYDMIHKVIKKWSNFDITEKPSEEETIVTDSVNEEEKNTSTGVTTEVASEKEPLSYTSPAPTEYNENKDEPMTEKKKRRKRQKKKRRHRRIRRIRRRQ